MSGILLLVKESVSLLCPVYKQTYFSLLNHGDFGKIDVKRINLTPNQIGVLVELSS